MANKEERAMPQPKSRRASDAITISRGEGVDAAAVFSGTEVAGILKKEETEWVFYPSRGVVVGWSVDTLRGLTQAITQFTATA